MTNTDKPVPNYRLLAIIYGAISLVLLLLIALPLLLLQAAGGYVFFLFAMLALPDVALLAGALATGIYALTQLYKWFEQKRPSPGQPEEADAGGIPL